MRKKALIILGVFLTLLFTSGITYSIFSSEALLTSTDQKIAEFIFNTERLTNLDLPLSEMKPGDEENFLFAVSNSAEEKYSKVNINYQIIVKTYHFIPFILELYQENNEEEILIGVCDENSSRNELNELVCNMPLNLFTHSTNNVHNYRLHVKFPEEYNDESYSGLVDFLNLEIKSWQKIEN